MIFFFFHKSKFRATDRRLLLTCQKLPDLGGSLVGYHLDRATEPGRLSMYRVGIWLKRERVRTRLPRQQPSVPESPAGERRARLRGWQRPLLPPTWFPGPDAGPARRAGAQARSSRPELREGSAGRAALSLVPPRRPSLACRFQLPGWKTLESTPAGLLGGKPFLL